MTSYLICDVIFWPVFLRTLLIQAQLTIHITTMFYFPVDRIAFVRFGEYYSVYVTLHFIIILSSSLLDDTVTCVSFLFSVSSRLLRDLSPVILSIFVINDFGIRRSSFMISAPYYALSFASLYLSPEFHLWSMDWTSIFLVWNPFLRATQHSGDRYDSIKLRLDLSLVSRFLK